VRPFSRNSSIASGDLSSSSPIPRAISGAFVNWIWRYSTTWMVAPGIEEVQAATRKDAGASLLQRVPGGVEIVHYEPDVPVRVGLLGAAGRERDDWSPMSRKAMLRPRPRSLKSKTRP